MKEAKGSLAKQAPERGRKSAATAHLTAPKEERTGPFAEQVGLGEGWNHVFRGGVLSRPQTSIPNSPSQPVTESSEKPKVTATRKTTRPQKSEPKTTAAPKLVSGKSKKKTATVSKPRPLNLTAPNLVVPNRIFTSPLEEISDLLGHVPLHTGVELTRRLLTSISSRPLGAARPRAVLKTVIIFEAECGSKPYEDGAS